MLPVDRILPDILAALRTHRNLVLEAPPGAGKTTRVPPALLALTPASVFVLEPRRLAARMAARRVAQELGEKPGQTVGYQVRFEEVAGPRTRLRFLTQGVLTRKLLSDPLLRSAGVVILDEFHERRLEGDLALALLRRLQRTARPDLCLVVMSATLDAAPIAAYLDDCPILRSEGRLHPIEIAHTPHSADPLEHQVAAAVERALAEGISGDILVFLPGAAEIRRAARACAPIADRANLILATLHGDLPPAEQDRAVLPAGRPKLILSTNVAESSITIEGVRCVIDSGLARIASDSPWTGLPTLETGRISKASATQRAGRAGRTGPGRVIRLYPQDDFVRRPEQHAPEIARRELSQVCLDLHALGLPDPTALPWLDPPPPAALAAAEELLTLLGVLSPEGALTGTGRRMAHYPLHPRLARLVVEADARGAGEDGCAIAALLTTGERGASDVLALLDRDWEPQTRRLYDQIRRLARPARQAGHDETALRIAILTAYPDRVAKRRPGTYEYLLSAGGAARLQSEILPDWIVAIDLSGAAIRLAAAIEPDWLLDLFPGRIATREGVEWNRTAERAEAVSALLYGNLTIDESRSGAPDPLQAASLLARKALEAGLARFIDPDRLAAWTARVNFAAEHLGWPAFSEDDLREALCALCYGQRSFADLRKVTESGAFFEFLESRLPDHRAFEEVAPERLRLPSGRNAKVNYEANQPPWVASRLQDFFGLKETPRVARGKVPVVVHLLAPNQRPVQTTTDLAGFWDRLYPQVRRELSRRYPRHAWPENPLLHWGK
ncbi:MAG: ATP-dependent helicase HrpB [Bryobacteraceae bacterium]